MAEATPRNPAYRDDLERLFRDQTVMETIGARLVRAAPGEAEIELFITPKVAQHNGFVHAGVVAIIADSACGCAAFTLMGPGQNVLTAEFKQNLLAPATGERLIASAKVVRAGRTLTVAQAEVHAEARGQRKLVALMTATLVGVEQRETAGD
ncbi:MAG TPA: PaaI family thioesterase [Microvirga sp.]|jgi:uncharacterized protein (TIGR00369 family)